MGVLEQFSSSDCNEFKEDFVLLMNMSFDMDEELGSVDHGILYNLPEFKSCLELFEKKYKDIVLKTRPNRYKIQIFFNRGVKEIFEETVSKIKNLRGVGRDFYSTVSISNTKMFKEAVESVHNRIYARYYAADAKSETIILKFNGQENMSELIYSKEGVVDEKSPEFKLCAYYGCLNGFDRNVDIKKTAFTFYKPSSFYKPGRGI